ncbi:MAG: hypothetical protein ACE5JD_08485 [Candidatus Methylomirabilia bacterium]
MSLPSPLWRVSSDGRADLELRHTRVQAGILAHATCQGKALLRSLPVLAKHLSFGLRDRQELERTEVSVARRPGIRVLLRGRLDGIPVKAEAYVIKGERCVYDMVYVAPPEEFSAGESDFQAFVRSFTP